MERNFFRRIEVAFPIERPQHRERIIQDLQTYLTESAETWMLRSDGTYERLPSVELKQSVQHLLLQRHTEGANEIAPTMG
jgi:polyphosphate kinase